MPAFAGMTSQYYKPSWHRMQPLDARFSNQHQLAGLHAGRAVTRHHVGLNDHRLPGTERLVRHWPGRAAFASQNRRQIAAAIAVQQIVDDGAAGLLLSLI